MAARPTAIEVRRAFIGPPLWSSDDRCARTFSRMKHPYTLARAGRNSTFLVGNVGAVERMLG
jgi:hypothetical protein